MNNIVPGEKYFGNNSFVHGWIFAILGYITFGDN